MNTLRTEVAGVAPPAPNTGACSGNGTRTVTQVIKGCAQRMGMACYRFVEITRKDGLGRALSLVRSYIRRVANPAKIADDFDRTWMVDTSGRINLWHTSIDSANARFGTAYTPSDPAWIEMALACIPEDFSTFNFIDLGCGKGRALLIAARYGFRRVIGVEFARELVEAARRNLQLSGIAGVEVVHEDAVDFSFPDQNLVVYLFNPFSPKVLQPILGKLSATKGLHKTYLIYANPLYADLVDEAGGFRPFATVKNTTLASIWTCS